MRTLLTLCCLVLFATTVRAEGAVFTLLRTVEVAELNNVLDAERTEFVAGHPAGPGYEMPPVSKASNAVELYTVRYPSRVPEMGGKPVMATGLLALPVLSNRSKLPLVAYLHGTVYGKYEVPSYAFRRTNPSGRPHYANAYETRYMVGLYAGNGYVLMAADYFGMGDDAANPEAYFVKQSTQQSNYDLYVAVQDFLKRKGIASDRFFVGGWSQGGINTTGFLQKLESEGVKVTGAYTASSPSDPFVALHGFMYAPRESDAIWLNTILALSVFAYENYHGAKDLGREVLRPEYYDGLRSMYERTYADESALFGLMTKWAKVPLLDYFKAEYRDPAYFTNSTYGRLLAASETYRQPLRTPVRVYYGTNDEAIRERVGELAVRQQDALLGDPALSSRNPMSLHKVVGGNHRFTYLTAAPAAKAWMDGLR